MRKNHSGISHALAKMTVLPLLLFGIFTMLFSFFWIQSSMEAEVHSELESIADTAILAYDGLYPGDYGRYGDENDLLFTKGDTILNSNYNFMDSLKESTGIDFTLFYGNVRVITTLCSDGGDRIVGTFANEQIVADVIDQNASAFYTNVDIFGKSYYCYYAPLFNSDGTCIGMLAAVMPSAQVRVLIVKATLPIFALTLVAAILAGIWSFSYSKQLVAVIQKLTGAFEKVSKGKFSNTVPAELLSRKDEFGSMSHSLVDMQASLRTLVEQDMLTGLHNRRFGQQKLDYVIENTRGTNRGFSIALGDIDFFKKFNDTYGHNCGDYVLKSVASIMKDTVKDHGYCVRWGGEEFLIVFTNGTYEDHRTVMQSLIENIRNHRMEYEGQTLAVTMTFGLIDASDYESSDAMTSKVDELLYHGKQNGRNRLVTLEDEDLPGPLR